MIGPIAFLDGLSGYVRNSTTNSADKPIRLARIDPDYDTFGGLYPDGVDPARVTFEGESTLSGKAYPVAVGYLPLPNARVWMVPIGNSYLIAGGAAPYTAQGFFADPSGDNFGVEFGGGNFFDSDSGLTLDTDAEIAGDLFVGGRIVVNNKKVLNSTMPTGPTNVTGNGVFQNVPGTSSMAFTKLYSSALTKLVVTMKLSMRMTSGAPGAGQIGVNINAVDTTIDNADIQLNVHAVHMGAREITGLAANTYTVQARCRSAATGKTLSFDNNDWLTLMVEEVPV